MPPPRYLGAPAHPRPARLTETESRARAALIEAEIRRRRWLADPVLWAEERLGTALWSKQREIVRAVRDHKRVAVRSANSCGKSFTAATLSLWWVDTHPPGSAMVITTAPTFQQVQSILWHEIGRAHAQGGLPGRVNQTNWWLRMPAGNEEQVAVGYKPSDDNTTAFQGRHRQYVLVILDEACGLSESIFVGADTVTTGDDCKLLAIGNPDFPLTAFGECFKPGSAWHKIGISAFDTPNFTGEEVSKELRSVLVSREWAEDKLNRWGADNPLYKAKVLGEFPEHATDGLIPWPWIERAQKADLSSETSPRELGVDVGAGVNKTMIALRVGGHVRVLPETTTLDHDTMRTAGAVKQAMRDHYVTAAKIDYIGVGQGLVDRLKEQNDQSIGQIVGVKVSQRALTENDQAAFHNLRAQGYWQLRELFREGRIDIDPNDTDLAAQLVDLKYKRTSGGKLLMESKDDMKRRGKDSPDRADAVMLAMLDLSAGEEPVFTECVWGSGRLGARGLAAQRR